MSFLNFTEECCARTVAPLIQVDDLPNGFLVAWVIFRQLEVVAYKCLSPLVECCISAVEGIIEVEEECMYGARHAGPF